MNLLLFANEGDLRHIAPTDPRLEHVRRVLQLRPGQRLYAGVLGGRRAWATILKDDPATGMTTEPEWEAQEPPQPLPLRVLVGLPRPQTARRILFEAAALGVRQLDFFQAQKGEPSYAQSSLWHSSQWQERLLLGAEQACVTSLPHVRHFQNLQDAIAAAAHPPENASTPELAPESDATPVPKANAAPERGPTFADSASAGQASAQAIYPDTHSEDIRLALDVYEAIAPLSHLLPNGTAPGRSLTLGIGPERGWSAAERTLLTDADFLLTHIGPRVLRAETAFVAALTLVTDKLLHPE